jgi:hypothetical protein
MNTTPWQRLKALWHAEFLSPKDLVRRAAVLTVIYVIAQVAGLREFTTILTGTEGSVELGWHMSAFLGLLYLCIYLAFVLLVPMLLISAGLLALYEKRKQRLGQAGVAKLRLCQ